MGCVASNGTASTLDELVVKTSSPEHGENDGKAFHRLFATRSVIGTGAFAQVHLAQEVSSGRDVAVKILDLRHAPDDDGRRKPGRHHKKLRAARGEVAALQLVGRHPRVTELHETFLDEALLYIVMEYCPSTLPQALLIMPSVTESLYAGVFRQIFQALEFIHSKGIVHRDVKPDNFLCDHGGDGDLAIKLCDFGLAEVVPSCPGAALLSSASGTAPYMSPEMVRGEGYGTDTDVWSAGVMAYVLMLGDFPHRPKVQPGTEAMKRAIAKGVPAPSFEPRLPNGTAPRPWVSRIGVDFLRSALARERCARPTAEQALALEWMGAWTPDAEEPSLRPALLGARHFGAFAAGNKKGASWETRSVEELLWIGQAKEERARSKASTTTSLTTTPTTSSEGALQASRSDSKSSYPSGAA